jgi:hypothetical protein
MENPKFMKKKINYHSVLENLYVWAALESKIIETHYSTVASD